MAVIALIGLTIPGCSGTGVVGSGPSEAVCDALVGPEPWLILFTEDYPGADCVAVGIHQSLQIWNKGFEHMTLEWQGEIRGIGSDYSYETGPIGELFEPGTYEIEAHPYSAPDLHVVPPEDSFSAAINLTRTGFGSIRLGMTIAEAVSASGHPIQIDPDLAPGYGCWQAIFPGDPYTPIFTVRGDGDENSIITAITTFYPGGEEVTVGDPNAPAPPLCVG